MTASSRRSSALRAHEPLIAELTSNERAALAADLLAANVRETIEAALHGATPESVEMPSAPIRGEYPPVMGPDQAAAYCAIGVNRMRDLLRTGAIHGRRSGRRWLVRREALEEWMQAEEAEQRRRTVPFSPSEGQRQSGMLGSSNR